MCNNLENVVREIGEMINALDQVITISLDPPDEPGITIGGFIRTGHPGRPAYDIQQNVLAGISVGHTQQTEVGDFYCCCARTIRCRLVTYGLSEPGPPVYTTEADEEGNITRTYHRGVCSDISQITDNKLD